MKRTSITMALLLAGTAASAQSGLDTVLSRLEGQGFGRFEIEQERGVIKIEAHRDGLERELLYSATTGELLKDTIEQRSGRDIPASESAGSLGGGVGPAAILARAGLGSVYGQLRSEGFEVIETKEELGVIKVEARNGSVERELRFDAQTGELLRDRVDDDDDGDDRSGRGGGDDDDDDDRGGRGGRGGGDDDDHDRGGRGGDDDDDRGGHGGRGGGDDDGDDRGGRGGRGGDDDHGGRGGSDDDDDDDDDDDRSGRGGGDDDDDDDDDD